MLFTFVLKGSFVSLCDECFTPVSTDSLGAANLPSWTNRTTASGPDSAPSSSAADGSGLSGAAVGGGGQEVCGSGGLHAPPSSGTVTRRQKSYEETEPQHQGQSSPWVQKLYKLQVRYLPVVSVSVNIIILV